MASPTFSAGTIGNVIPRVSLAPTKNAAGYWNASTTVDSRIVSKVVTGGTAPTATVVYSLYGVTNNATQITLSAAVTAGAESISVSSDSGMDIGDTICLQQASGSLLGELVKISGAITGSGPFTVPISVGTTNSYSEGDNVFQIVQTPIFLQIPLSTSGTYSTNSSYSAQMDVGPGEYVHGVVNNDGVATVTVVASANTTPAFQ
jgi:hypothetical protein